jgi:hypothetical protein
MGLYRVREGYVVHLGNSKTLSPGAIFEPDQEVLESQGWKIEPVKEAAKVAENPQPETREMESSPQDRMVKKPPVKK